MNKIGIHGAVWVGTWRNDDCARAIRSTAEAGYDFIEVPLLDPFATDVAFSARELARAGIGMTASLGLDADTNIASEDNDVVKRGEELLTVALQVVRDLGGSDLCGVIHSAMMKNMSPLGDRARNNAIGVLHRLGEKATVAKVQLHLEVVNRYESNFLNTGAQAQALLREMHSDVFKIHLDTYHMNIEEGSVGAAIENCGEDLGYFHIGESHRGYLGTGTVDFQSVFRSLNKIGYNGPIAFESFSSAVVDPKLSNMLGVWRNLWSDSMDLATHARRFIDVNWHAARQETMNG